MMPVCRESYRERILDPCDDCRNEKLEGKISLFLILKSLIQCSQNRNYFHKKYIIVIHFIIYPLSKVEYRSVETTLLNVDVYNNLKENVQNYKNENMYMKT